MNSVSGIGVDLVEVNRIRAIHRRHGNRFFARVMTPSEQSYCLSKSDFYPSIAARVAAKEAVAKAFGVGIGGELKWTSVEVVADFSGAPKVVLDAMGRRLLKKMKGKGVLLSLSHSAGVAIAMAVIC